MSADEVREALAAASARAAGSDLLAPGDPNMQMDAYYYGFDRTGVGIIDRILSAVAIAGKGCHNTDGWTDSDIAAYYDDRLTHEERIQHAADDAAAALRAALSPSPAQSPSGGDA